MAVTIKTVATVLLTFLEFCSSARIASRLDILDGSFPPNEPAIPEINGAFTIKIVARYDNISGGYYQRMFDFGNGPFGENIILGQVEYSTNVAFQHYTGGAGTIKQAMAYNALTEGTTDTWEVSIDTTGQMSITKNGSQLAFKNTGVVPLAGQTRSSKLLGQSNWAIDDDLRGTVLGLQVINHSEAASQDFRSMDLLNMPTQIFGHSFVASAYVRFDNLSSDRYYQRIFDIGNGPGVDNVIFSQNANLNVTSLVVFNSQGIFQCSASNVLVQGQMALWRAQVTAAGSFRIEKNGAILAECNFPSFVGNPVVRNNVYIGSSNWNSDDETQGVILGLRIDLDDSS